MCTEGWFPCTCKFSEIRGGSFLGPLSAFVHVSARASVFLCPSQWSAEKNTPQPFIFLSVLRLSLCDCLRWLPQQSGMLLLSWEGCSICWWGFAPCPVIGFHCLWTQTMRADGLLEMEMHGYLLKQKGLRSHMAAWVKHPAFRIIKGASWKQDRFLQAQQP